MNDNNIHNQDIFSESIKSKLENHQMPLDESVWKGIEKQLATKKKRIVPVWLWLTGGIAASFLLFFTLNPFKTNDGRYVENKINEKENIVVSEGKTHGKSNVNNQITSVPEKKDKLTYKTKLLTKETLSSFTNNNINQSVEDIHQEKISTFENQTSTEFLAKEVKKGLADSDLQVKKDSIPAKKTEPKLTSLPEMPEILDVPEEKPKKNTKKNWLLAANVGTSGSADLNFANGKLYANVGTVLSPNEAYGDGLSNLVSSTQTTILDPGHFTNIQYLSPLSVGFSVQKSLNATLSLSSGLTYTYLRSNYSLKNQWEDADASLELHYLGIPLHLNVMIADKKHWNYYFSVGGTIEKGLRSVYRQKIDYNGASTQQTTIYSKIDGVQTSSDVAFGVGYKLHKNWSLFFEPKVIYYFKNNQPMSARTDTPLNVGFSSGLKVGF